MTVRVFGIRHHGPGSARALGTTLVSWSPDAVLVEGPPEADPVLALAASEAMRPPVALLAFRPADPRRGIFFPLAAWSPEWVAIRFAVERDVHLRMIDLPAAVALSSDLSRRQDEDGVGDRKSDRDRGQRPLTALRVDPLMRLAAAAGYDDPERWWEDVVEHRGAGEGPWEALGEVMAELRADVSNDASDATPPGDATTKSGPEREVLSEASMRQHIRAAEKAGFERIAVVCGAWHVPALSERPPARADAALLTGLPKDKVTVTWIPWTNDRLTWASGYGAGVVSPGWYSHLYQHREAPVERWLARVAVLLRGEGLEASPASVVDAVRLAETLATMRGRPLAGLPECTDAARSVLAAGSELPLALVHRRLVIGVELGEVPAETPLVPLATDLAAHQKRLRLAPTADERLVDLDLRRDIDLQRSHLMHRLALLEVPWGNSEQQSGDMGTFHERWALTWSPELSLRIVEAGMWGPTIETAAVARALSIAGEAADLGSLTALVERCLLSALSEAVGGVMEVVGARAASSTDEGELLDALPALARTLRYGNVRRTETQALDRVVRGLVARACVGLAPACASLDDDAARLMAGRLDSTTSALALLGVDSLRSEWMSTLARLADARTLHGLVAGRTCRILSDAAGIPADGLARRLSAALSRDPMRAASWIEGLVRGSGLLLVHDHALLAMIDTWIAEVSTEVFDDLLPILRRAMSQFEAGERRLLGESVRHIGGSRVSTGESRFRLDHDRGRAGLDRALLLLTGKEPT